MVLAGLIGWLFNGNNKSIYKVPNLVSHPSPPPTPLNAAGVVSEEVLAGTETDPRQEAGKEGDHT